MDKKDKIESSYICELDALSLALNGIFNSVNPRMNIYRAMGLVNQEKHHSSFFAGLLNPNNPHKLGDAVLISFLKRLYSYQTKSDGVTTPDTNSHILAIQGIKSQTDLLALLQGYVTVDLEKKTIIKINGKSGRMDIVIEIPQSQTVIVIENKTGTSTHDDQLRKYEEDVDVRFESTYKKIFVYLSPLGELPYNRGGNEKYNNHYCVFDYTQICEIISELITDLQNTSINIFKLDKNDKKTLIYGLEEYLDMCKTDLLRNNVGSFEKCEEVISGHPEAIKKLLEYLQSPTEENVIKYVAELITGYTDAGHARKFATQTMKEYFYRNGEEFNLNVFHCYCHPKDDKKFNGYEVFLEIENINNVEPYKGQWTPVQQKFLNELLARGLITSIPRKSKRLISGFTLLSSEDCYKSFDEVKAKLDINVSKFMDELVKIEDILKSITPA